MVLRLDPKQGEYSKRILGKYETPRGFWVVVHAVAATRVLDEKGTARGFWVCTVLQEDSR